MERWLSALVLIVVTVSPSAAQMVYGRTTDAVTGDRVGIVAITLVRITDAGLAFPDSTRVVSDSAGHYGITSKEPGRFVIRVRRLGYVSATTEPFDLADGELLPLDLRLAPEGVALDPIKVVASGSGLEPGRLAFSRRCALNTGLCLNRDSVAVREPRVVLDALRAIEGLSVYWAGTRGYQLRLMNGGCAMVFLNNSVSPMWRTTGGRGGTLDINMLDPRSIIGVEVYLEYRDVPLELRESLLGHELLPRPGSRRPGACGAILIWTREAW